MNVRLWTALISHWSKMIVGQSYWHAAQGLGQSYSPGELKDYYRDYSSKVHWTGGVDQSHLPLIQEPAGKPFHHPLVLAQKALGHWSSWLGSTRKNEKHKQSFLHLAVWLTQAQEAKGSWDIPSMHKPIYTVPYSSLVQGQAISVLVRAYSVTQDESYLMAANRGLQFMLTPIENGGVSRYTPAGPVLEEYPQHQANTVLNGWVSALFGLYDVLLVKKESYIRNTLEASLNALITYLPKFDAGYWSFYDSSGTIASPYYHRVHITQLRALELTFPYHSNVFAIRRACFEQQVSSTMCRARAFFFKACQKIRQPPLTVMIQTKTK